MYKFIKRLFNTTERPKETLKYPKYETIEDAVSLYREYLFALQYKRLLYEISTPATFLSNGGIPLSITKSQLDAFENSAYLVQMRDFLSQSGQFEVGSIEDDLERYLSSEVMDSLAVIVNDANPQVHPRSGTLNPVSSEELIVATRQISEAGLTGIFF